MRNNHRYLYGPLLERSLENFQVQHLARNYDFGKQSKVAALIVQEANSRMGEVEKEVGIKRIHPFHLYLRWREAELELPLFQQECLDPLINGSGDFGDCRKRIFEMC